MKAKGKCITPYCRNDRRVKDRTCSKCQHRARKAEDPVKYTYFALRSNAKRRGKFFDLTLEQFRGFVSDNMYMKLKGNTKESLSIDRIDNQKGYTISNIRAITVSKNSKKRNQEYKTYGTEPIEYSKDPTNDNYVPF